MAFPANWMDLLAGYREVRLNGVPLPPRSNLNFTGLDVAITDNTNDGTTDVAISGGGGAGGFFVDEFSPNRGEVQIERVGFTTHTTASFGIDTTKIGTYAALDRWVTLDGSAVSIDDRRLTLGTGGASTILELGGVGGKGALLHSPIRSEPVTLIAGTSGTFDVDLSRSNVIDVQIAGDLTLNFVGGLPGQRTLVRIIRTGVQIATLTGLTWSGEPEGQQSSGAGSIDTFVVEVDSTGTLYASGWRRGDDTDTRVYGTTSVTLAPTGLDAWVFGSTYLSLTDGTDALLQLVNAGSSVAITSTTHTGDLAVQALGGSLALSSAEGISVTATLGVDVIGATSVTLTASTTAVVAATDGAVTLGSASSSGTPTFSLQGEADVEVVRITAPAAGAGVMLWGAGATSVTLTQDDYTYTHATVYQTGPTVAIRSGTATGASHGVAGIVTMHGGDATGQYGVGGSVVLEGGAGTDTSSAPTGGSGGDVILRPGLGLHHDGDIKFENAKSVTIAAGGAATALPALPTGYLQVSINGAIRNIPFYS